MKKEKILYRSARLAGVLLLISVIPHATLGTAELLTHIKLGDIRSSMVATVKNVWIFSSIMLFLSGTWLLYLSGDLSAFRRKAWFQAVLIGLGYSGGAIGAMAWAGIQIHLIIFALIGIIVLLPTLWWSRAFRNSEHKIPVDHIKSTTPGN